MNSLLEHALAYARRGWAIHPLRPGEKIPLLADWPGRATTDEAAIRRWWAETPRANIGLCAGASGLIVVDLDVKNGVDGLKAWAALGVEVTTVTSQTASGGRHLFYAAGGGAGNRRILQPGIEILAGKSNVVLPPSVLAGGRTYRWLSPPGETATAPFPEALWKRPAVPGAAGGPGAPPSMAATMPAGIPGTPPSVAAGMPALPVPALPEYGLKALGEEADEVRRAAPGGRNDRLNLAAFRLGRLVGAGQIDEAAVHGGLLAAALGCGLAEREALATIRSGLEAGMAQPWELRGALPTGAAGEPARMPGTPPSMAATMPAGTPGTPPSVAAGMPAGMPALPVTALEMALAAFEPNDEGNAQAVNTLFGDRFRHCAALGWLAWADTHWVQEDADKRLIRAVVEALLARRAAAAQLRNEAAFKAARPSATNVRNAIYLFAAMRTVSVDALDRQPDHLNVQNGRLDLRSGRLEPHRPEHGFTYCLPAGYHEDADTSEWEAWVLQATGGDEATALFLQQAIGYSLTGRTSEECLFYIYGPPRAGKGLLTETILAMMGRRPLADEIDYKSLVRTRENDANSADLAALRPCRIVFASESERGDWLNAALLKSLTGGNLVNCAFKYLPFFSYRPQYAIWLTSNHPVSLDVDDAAAWSRIRAIRFPNSWLGREDRGLKEYWSRPAQLEQVLAWAVHGAMMWYQTGRKGMVVPPAVEKATEAARDELDYVGHWLEECTERTGRQEDFATNAALRESYQNWCEENGVSPRKQAALTQALKGKGLDAGVVRKANGRNCRGVVGLRLKPLHATLRYTE